MTMKNKCIPYYLYVIALSGLCVTAWAADHRLCFIKAYPGAALAKDQNIKFNGQRFLWHDNKKKNFKEMLNAPSLKDTLSIPYHQGPIPKHIAKNQDPGRFRHQNFLKAIYGNNRQNISRNLIKITWPFGKKRSIRFNQNNQAAKALKKVIQNLKQLPKKYRPYLKNIGGSFSYRTIAGTKRLSAHSYGIAIDINVKRSDYWRYHKKNLTRENIPYQNKIPLAIVKAFEKEGFIWGGRWYHYDTMHFEYRPEFLSCFAPADNVAK